MAATEGSSTIRNLKTCSGAAITGSSLVSTNEDVRGHLKCDQPLLINNVEYKTHSTKPPSSWTVRCIELSSDYQGDTDLNVEIMFEVVRVVKAKKKPVDESATSDSNAAASSKRPNEQPKAAASKASQPIKPRKAAGAKASAEAETAGAPSKEAAPNGPPPNNASGSKAENTEASATIDISRPPPKPPRKLDPIKKPAVPAKPPATVPPDAVVPVPSSAPAVSAVSNPTEAASTAESIEATNVEVSAQATEQTKQLEEARRLAHERVMRKMKADRDRIEALEKEKREREERRQEASARKAKLLQDKTLERVSLLKEQKEREKLTQQEAVYEEESRRMQSQEYAQSQEYIDRMKRLRRDAQRRLREAERREEIRQAQEDHELRQKLRQKKQQVDVSTTFVPLTQKQRRLLEQQRGVLSQQDVSAEEAAGYFGSVPRTRSPPRPLDTVSEYDDNDGDAYDARRPSDAAYEDSPYHYYTDEGYSYPAARRPVEGYDDVDDDDGVEREEEAYIRGDAAFFERQEQAGRRRHDEDVADEYRHHQPHLAHQQQQQHRARSAGQSVDLQRLPAEAPEARAATSQQPKAASSHASDASELLRYQEPVVAFTEYAAAPSHRHGAGAAPQQQHQPQPPALTQQKTTKHGASRASLHSTATGDSTTSNRSMKNAQPLSEETPMQAARRRQQLEAAVETWLQGEDDTTLAAKAELLTPAPSPARSKPPAGTAVGAASNANKKTPAKAGDGDSSDWSSDDDDADAPVARAVTFAAGRPPNGAAAFDESDGDDSEYDAHNTRGARHPRSTSKPAAAAAAAPAKRPVPAASTAASEQFHAKPRRADTPEDASDVSDLTDQEDQRRHRANRHELRVMPDVARPAGNSDQSSTMLRDRHPHAAVCAGVRDGQPQPSITRRGPQQHSSPPKPFLGGPPVPAIVQQPSASSPTNLSGPSSGRKHKRAKPFQRLPVIPIAPYNPVPANY